MSKKKRIYVYFRVFVQIFEEEKILRDAASLTFVTVLGLIPFIIFLVSFFPDIPSLNLVDQLKGLLVKILIPEAAAEVNDYFDTLFQRRVSMSVINIIMLVVSSYSLFASITSSFDNILRIDTGLVRNKFGTLIKLFGTVVIGFFIFALLISTSSLPFFQGFFTLNIIRQLSNLVLPLLCWFLLINVAYYFLPNIKLKQRSIWLSAAITSIVWFIAKVGFDFWINNLTQMKQIFGIISSFPIFLFWIYLNWILVLSGVIILAIQNKSYNTKKEFEVQANISLIINKKSTRNIMSDIKLSDEAQLRKLLIELLKKEKK